MARQDEGRIHVGTHGQVEYLGRTVRFVVTEIRVNPTDQQLYGKCESGGDFKWIELGEIEEVSSDGNTH
jgi:hypothetical protein